MRLEASIFMFFYDAAPIIYDIVSQTAVMFSLLCAFHFALRLFPWPPVSLCPDSKATHFPARPDEVLVLETSLVDCFRTDVVLLHVRLPLCFVV